MSVRSEMNRGRTFRSGKIGLVLARVIALIVGAFYLASGAWSFLYPSSFYGTVASFVPYNLHLLHDLGAFQVGLGLVLVVPVLLKLPLRAPLIAVLAASLLHVVAHLEDIRLGGHPATDLPALLLIVVALGIALTVDLRQAAARR